MKNKIFFFIIIISSSLMLSCSNTAIRQPYSVVSGIVSPETYYSRSTFIDKDTVVSLFDNNNLDYWIVGTNNANKEMTTFRDNLRNINKKLKGYNITEMPIAADADTSKTSPMLYSITAKSTMPPSIYRDTKRRLLYETFYIKYDGSLVSYFDNYIALLDSGYIVAPVPCAEVIGPEWNIGNGMRLNLIIRQDTKDPIIDALTSCRFFISSGDDVNMSFSINDNKIGSVIKSYDGLNIQYRITNKDNKINAVEIISNNGEIVYASHSLDENETAGKCHLDNVNDFAYFYLKSYFENGETAFTAPIWTSRSRQVLINNISSHPIAPDENEYGSTVTFTAENIADEHLNGINWTITDSYGNTLKSDIISLKKKEKRKITAALSFDTPPDNVTITVSIGDYTVRQTVPLHIKKVGRIIFDASHHNIFHDDFHKIRRYLREDNHIVEVWNDYEQFYDYDTLSQYDMIIITSPNKVFELVDADMRFFGRLNKFVYNGGKIILAGYNDETTAMPIIFMNECLRIVYSPLRFAVDSKYNLSPIRDAQNRYGNNENMPTFSSLYPTANGIAQIYLKNPIEFRSNTSVPVTKMYGIRSLIALNKTTSVNGRIPKYTDNYSAAVQHRFGFGKVVVLSGINFSDYDIDNLDNKKWFIALVNSLISDEQ